MIVIKVKSIDDVNTSVLSRINVMLTSYEIV